MSIEAKRDKVRNFVVARHIVTSDPYLVHKEDVEKLGTDEKIGVYEAQAKGFIPAKCSQTKGTYLHPCRIFIGRYLELRA